MSNMIPQILSARSLGFVSYTEPLVDVPVGGLEHEFYSIQLGVSSSQLTKSYFSEGQVYHQPVSLGFLGYSMGISGSKNGGTVPYKAIFCEDIPLHKPEK